MLKRVGGLVLALIAAAGIAALVPRVLAATVESADLTVHEWGTFTSIAGSDGQAIEWRPLTGPSDLPCFVTALNPSSIKISLAGAIPVIKATVRMETPVLYFYTPTEQTVNASVTFPHGVISEWYPQASVPPAAPIPTMANSLGRIRWDNVRIRPGARETFPTDPDGSHYYAARETDAAPLQVGSQQEKFLFYRGLASFTLPLSATLDGDGRLMVQQRGPNPIDTFVFFERRGGRLGYRVAHATGANTVIDRPDLTATVESLRQELRGTLTKQGLYPREAAAMVETWRDSWFEEGARLFYVLPQVAVDAILPLEIEPKPSHVTRVFVGRMEIVTPEMASEVADAIRRGDRGLLNKYGRFLEPISQMVQSRLTTTHDEKRIEEAMKLVAPRQAKAACAAPAAVSAGASGSQQ